MINFTFHVNYWTVKLCNILRIPIIEKRGLRYTKLRTSYSKQKVYYRILFSKFHFFNYLRESVKLRELFSRLLQSEAMDIYIAIETDSTFNNLSGPSARSRYYSPGQLIRDIRSTDSISRYSRDLALNNWQGNLK